MEGKKSQSSIFWYFPVFLNFIWYSDLVNIWFLELFGHSPLEEDILGECTAWEFTYVVQLAFNCLLQTMPCTKIKARWF